MIKVAVFLAVLTVALVLLEPLSSAFPDGLERAMLDAGIHLEESGGSWLPSIVGVLLVFGLGALAAFVGRGVRK